MRTLVQALWLFIAPVALIAEESDDRAPVEPSTLPTPDQPIEEVTPAITTLDDGQMRIGQITFNPKDRKIRFPASINQTAGLLEFLIVHENGKIHESLLVTDISAINLNLAFKLLRYKASRELYLKLDPDGSLSGEFEEATEEEKKESRLRIHVEHEVDGEARKVPVRDWINHAVTEKNMADSPWVYGGSFHYDGRFVAQSSGDLAAIFLSNAALINFSGEDNELDEVWLPHPTRVPAEGTPVTVIIEPFQP